MKRSIGFEQLEHRRLLTVSVDNPILRWESGVYILGKEIFPGHWQYGGEDTDPPRAELINRPLYQSTHKRQ